MSLSSNLVDEVRQVIDKIQQGCDPENCVPDLWKLKVNRDTLDEAFQGVCLRMWLQLGDTALNRSGYSNSISSFWEEIIGKKEEKKLTDDVEHLDESWYF
jgi:hypothetical protein